MVNALLYFANRSEARQERKAKATQTRLDGVDDLDLLVPIAIEMHRQPVRKEMNFALAHNIATLGGTHGE